MTREVQEPGSKEDILEGLSSNPEGALERLYRQYRNGFLGFAQAFGGADHEQLESFHDALLGFYEIVRTGRYDPARASVKTLIFTIGKYKLLTRLGKKPREQYWDEVEWAAELTEQVASDHSIEVEKVNEAIKKLGDRCRRIIELFYYSGLTIREIVDRMGYKNENVVKAHKSRCMKTLKELCAEPYD